MAFHDEEVTFLSRLVANLAVACRFKCSAPPIHTLDFTFDWGSSEEFMHAVAHLTAVGNRHDLIITYGVSWTGRMLARSLGNTFGLQDDDWIRVEQKSKNEQTVLQYRINMSRLEDA